MKTPNHMIKNTFVVISGCYSGYKLDYINDEVASDFITD